ncbi:MAG: 6-bladed beta-propeller, partial [bacterium]
MRKLTIITAAALTALTAFCVYGDWVYEGQWGSHGTANGRFDDPYGVAVSAGNHIFVTDSKNDRVQYFAAA